MNVVTIIKYAFTLAGLVMLAGAAHFYTGTRSFLATATAAEGTVIDMARSRSDDSDIYKPVVRFAGSNGEAVEFVSNTGSNPPDYEVGEKVRVWFDPAAPHKARIDAFFPLWGATAIFGGLGAIFFLIGGGIILAGIREGRKVEYLKIYGTPVDTELQSVQMNSALTVNGRHPYRIFTQWLNPATSELHVFESDNLWFDPTDHIGNRRIRVLIDNNDPKRYLMDLSFLPRLAQ